MCMKSGIFPQSLKIGRVILLLKKGDPSSCDNYRFITTTPIISKIIEIVLKTRITVFLNLHNILSDKQYGFRKSVSVVHAVTDITHSTLRDLDGGVCTTAVMCDLSKAFDSVSHSILQDKLDRYGISGKPLQLLMSFLSNRQQFVDIFNKKSSIRAVMHGVPQGSVLGPTLFIIYMNDLPNFLQESEAYLYADDTTRLCRGSNDSDLEQMSGSALLEAEDWFNANRLALNKSKTNKITWAGNRNVELVNESVKLLGFFLDPQLNWRSHVSSIVTRLSKARFVMGRLRQVVSMEVLKMAYFGLAHCHLTYGVLVWGATMAAQEVLIAQKKIIRTMCGVAMNEHARPLFRKHKILTVPSLYILEAIL